MTNSMIPDEAVEAAHAAVYGPDAVQFSRQTWLYDALEAAAPHMLAELLEALARVEKLRQEFFDLSNDDDWPTQLRAAYRDASRAIYTALH